MSPQRIQLSRAKGWRKPEGAIVVSRPSVFGNPFAPKIIPGWATASREMVVGDYRNWLAHPDYFWRTLTGGFASVAESVARRDALLDALPRLHGQDLCCWCHIGQPCHADVLLEMANSGPSSVVSRTTQ